MIKQRNSNRFLSLVLILSLLCSLFSGITGPGNYSYAAAPAYWPSDPSTVIPVTAASSPVNYSFTADETKWFSVVPNSDYFYIRVRIRSTNFGGSAATYSGTGQFNLEVVDPLTGLSKTLNNITCYDSTNNGSGYIMYTSTLFPDDLSFIHQFGNTAGTNSYFVKVTATAAVDVDISYNNVNSAGDSTCYPTGTNNLYLTTSTFAFRYYERLLMSSDFNSGTYTYNGAASPVKIGYSTPGSDWDNITRQPVYAYLEFGASNNKTTAFRATINGFPADWLPSGSGIDTRTSGYKSTSSYYNDAKGWIKYNGSSVSKSYFTFNCNHINWGGPNTVVIDAVPQNLQSWKTYTFTFTAPAGSNDTSFSWIKAGTNTNSSDNNQATLVSGDNYKVTLTPGTASGTNIYFAVDPTVCYHNGATLSDGAGYTYDLTEYGNEWNNSAYTPTPFTAPAQGTSKDLTLIVTAQDNVTTKTYTITIENPVPSSNNNIAALSIQPKNAGSYSVLTESGTTFSNTFDSEQTTFDLKIDTETSVKSVTYVLNGGSASALTANASKNQFTQTSIPVASGSGVISIAVTAEDDSTKTYTFNISRPASSAATLADIALGSSYTASVPGFNSNTKTYDVFTNQNSPYILAKASNSAATIVSITNIATISQPWMNGYYGNTLNLSGLANGNTMSVQITVRAEDGITTDTYTLNITKDTTGPTVASIDYPQHQSVVPISFDKIKFTFDENAATYTSGPYGRIMYFGRPTVQEAAAEYSASAVSINGNSAVWTHSSSFTSSKYPGTKYFLRLNSSVGYKDLAGNLSQGYQTSTVKSTVDTYNYFTVGHLNTLSVNGSNVDYNESEGKFKCTLPAGTASALVSAVTENSNSNSDTPSETVTGVTIGGEAATASGSTYSGNVSGLIAGTNSFDVVVTTSNGTETYPLEISITDTAPPVWATGYPKIDSALTTSSSLKVLVEADEAGTYYYLVLPHNSTVPGAAEVKAGNAPTGVTKVASGSGSISAATEAGFALSSLSAATTYDIYVLAEDDESTPNVQASAAKVEGTTSSLPDTTPSVWATGYPKIDSALTTSSSLKVLVEADEAGTYYYLVLPHNSTVPGAAEVKAGNAPTGVTKVASGSGSISAATEAGFALSSLSAATTYDIYVLAEDDESTPNVQASAAKVEGTTSSLPSNGNSGSGTSQIIINTLPDNYVNLEVNGETQTGVATKETVTENGQNKVVVTLTDKIKDTIIDKKAEGSTITIPIATEEAGVGQISGQIIKNMGDKSMSLEVKTNTASYKISAYEININDLKKSLGDVEPKDIKVNIEITVLPDKELKKIQESVQGTTKEILTQPIDFSIKATCRDKTVEVNKFDKYVEREVAISDTEINNLIEKIKLQNPGKELDVKIIINSLSKITTAVMHQKDNTSTHIPTEIVYKNGKYYAKINSLTNSTYYLIYNEEKFDDISQHWAKDSIQNMANRTVINGMGDGRFEPDRDVTRGEFVKMLVTGLGLHRALEGEAAFQDVTQDKYYFDDVYKGKQYDLIKGINELEFVPDKKITREELIAMVVRSLELTNIKETISNEEADLLLSKYTDSDSISGWARNSVALGIKLGIVNGDKDKIMPLKNATRAESIVIIERLLKDSELINRDGI